MKLFATLKQPLFLMTESLLIISSRLMVLKCLIKGKCTKEVVQTLGATKIPFSNSLLQL